MWLSFNGRRSQGRLPLNSPNLYAFRASKKKVNKLLPEVFICISRPSKKMISFRLFYGFAKPYNIFLATSQIEKKEWNMKLNNKN